MRRTIHVSQEDGEPWLPFVRDYVHGPLDERSVSTTGGGSYRLAKVTDGDAVHFIGLNASVFDSVLGGDHDCLPVNLLALNDWPDWDATYEGADLLTRHVGLCHVILEQAKDAGHNCRWGHALEEPGGARAGLRR